MTCLDAVFRADAFRSHGLYRQAAFWYRHASTVAPDAETGLDLLADAEAMENAATEVLRLEKLWKLEPPVTASGPLTTGRSGAPQS